MVGSLSQQYSKTGIGRSLQLLAGRTPELLSLLIIIIVQIEHGWSPDRIRITIEHAIPVFLISLAITLVLLVGEIDLAITSTMAASGVLFMVLGRSLTPGGALLITGLVVGTVAWLYGYVVAKLRVNSLAFSLGVMFLVQYVVYWNWGHLSVESEPCIGFLQFVDKFPSQVIITILVAIIAWMLLNKTNWGLWCRAVGDNAVRFDRLSGKKARVVATAFAFAGIVSVVAALLSTARAESAQTAPEHSLLFWALGAAIVGGVRLSGGRGTVWMAVRGATLVALITESLNCMNINSDVRQALFGILIVVVVAAPALFGRRLHDAENNVSEA